MAKAKSDLAYQIRFDLYWFCLAKKKVIGEIESEELRVEGLDMFFHPTEVHIKLMQMLQQYAERRTLRHLL